MVESLTQQSNTAFLHSNQSFELPEHESKLPVLAPEPSDQGSSVVELPPPVEGHTSKTSADNILRFIETRIANLLSEGASREEVEEAFTQAESGFERGVGEAVEILQGLGVYSEEIAGGVEETRKLFAEGISELREEILGEAKSRPEVAQANVESSRYSERSVSVDQRFALQLQTRDGDKVEIYLSNSLDLRSQLLEIIEENRETQASFSEFNLSDEAVVKVQGELDAGELEAIAELFEDIRGVADAFYSGNLGEALGQALELSFDGNELASLDLNLQQQVTSTAVDQYRSVSQLGAPETSSDALVRGARHLLEAFSKTALFDHPRELLKGLLQHRSKAFGEG